MQYVTILCNFIFYNFSWGYYIYSVPPNIYIYPIIDDYTYNLKKILYNLPTNIVYSLYKYHHIFHNCHVIVYRCIYLTHYRWWYYINLVQLYIYIYPISVTPDIYIYPIIDYNILYISSSYYLQHIFYKFHVIVYVCIYLSNYRSWYYINGGPPYLYIYPIIDCYVL